MTKQLRARLILGHAMEDSCMYSVHVHLGINTVLKQDKITSKIKKKYNLITVHATRKERTECEREASQDHCVALLVKTLYSQWLSPSRHI